MFCNFTITYKAESEHFCEILVLAFRESKPKTFVKGYHRIHCENAKKFEEMRILTHLITVLMETLINKPIKILIVLLLNYVDTSI